MLGNNKSVHEHVLNCAAQWFEIRDSFVSLLQTYSGFSDPKGSLSTIITLDCIAEVSREVEDASCHTCIQGIIMLLFALKLFSNDSFPDFLTDIVASYAGFFQKSLHDSSITVLAFLHKMFTSLSAVKFNIFPLAHALLFSLVYNLCIKFPCIKFLCIQFSPPICGKD